MKKLKKWKKEIKKGLEKEKVRKGEHLAKVEKTKMKH